MAITLSFMSERYNRGQKVQRYYPSLTDTIVRAIFWYQISSYLYYLKEDRLSSGIILFNASYQSENHIWKFSTKIIFYKFHSCLLHSVFWNLFLKHWIFAICFLLFKIGIICIDFVMWFKNNIIFFNLVWYVINGYIPLIDILKK